jgi:hypothetical protein
MEPLKTRIAHSPKLALVVGKALFCLGGALIALGLFGRAGLYAVNTIRIRGSQAVYQQLSEAYPSYPVWFIPEGVFGFAVALLVAATGAYVGFTAKGVLDAIRPAKRRRR